MLRPTCGYENASIYTLLKLTKQQQKKKDYKLCLYVGDIIYGTLYINSHYILTL